MGFRVARALFFLLSAATAALGALAYVSQAGGFPFGHPSFYGCSLVAVVVAVLGGVCCFTPFDQPGSTPVWSAPLVGFAAGVGLWGIILFTASFLWLGVPVLLYAGAVFYLGHRIGLGPEQDLEPDIRGRNALLVLSVLIGSVVSFVWRPQEGGLRPLPRSATIVPATTPPASESRRGRIVRKDTSIQIKGERLRLGLSLERPRLVLETRDQQIVVEPCLYIERGTLDGFFAWPMLNGFTLEPRGLATVSYREGERMGWVRAEYNQFAPAYGGLAVGALGPLEPGVIRAVVEIEVDLLGRPGRGRPPEVRIDALTYVSKPLAVERVSLGWLKLSGIPEPTLEFALGGGWKTVPPAGEPPLQSEFLLHDGEVFRALRGRTRDQGPYELLSQGAYEGWFVVQGGRTPILVVHPDWQAQASLALSAGAGHGLKENCLLFWQDSKGAVKLLFDPGSNRLGPGSQSTLLTEGIYRNRIVISTVLPGENAARRARNELALLGPLRSGS